MKTNCLGCSWFDMKYVFTDQGEALFSVECRYGHWWMRRGDDERAFAWFIQESESCTDFKERKW